MREIEGTIKYKITVDEKTGWHLEYTQSSENDLAVMAIGQQLMEYSEQHFEETLKDQSLSTKSKTFFKGRLTKVRAAKFGLQLMCSYLMSVIDEYHAFVADNKKQQEPAPLTEKEQKAILEMMGKMEGKA